MTAVHTARDDVRARIVDEAARLLRERGPAAVTTRAVADAAGVQPPAIYRIFGDKDGLLDAVAEHVMATYVAAKSEAVAAAAAGGVDPVEDLLDGWRAQIDFGLANPTLFRLLSDPARVEASPAARAGYEVLAGRVHRVAATGRLQVAEPLAVDMIHAAGVGAIETLLSRPADARDPRLAEAMIDVVLRAILRDGPPAAEAPDVAATVAFRAVLPRLHGLSDAERALMAEWLDRLLA
jgi:AcrR family transcriptional regulator